MFGGGGRPGGQRQQRKQKTSPIRLELSVTLEDIMVGKSQLIRYSKSFTCSECSGKGGSKVKTCSPCKGSGIITKVINLGPQMYSQ